jgi:hypothetical protein
MRTPARLAVAMILLLGASCSHAHYRIYSIPSYHCPYWAPTQHRTFDYLYSTPPFTRIILTFLDQDGRLLLETYVGEGVGYISLRFEPAPSSTSNTLLTIRVNAQEPLSKILTIPFVEISGGCRPSWEPIELGQQDQAPILVVRPEKSSLRVLRVNARLSR